MLLPKAEQIAENLVHSEKDVPVIPKRKITLIFSQQFYFRILSPKKNTPCALSKSLHFCSYAGRPPSASTATGNKHHHNSEQEDLINQALE